MRMALAERPRGRRAGGGRRAAGARFRPSLRGLLLLLALASAACGGGPGSPGGAPKAAVCAPLSDPTGAFRTLLADPIPTGVRDLRAAGTRTESGYDYFFRFEATPAARAAVVAGLSEVPCNEVADEFRLAPGEAACAPFFRPDPSGRPACYAGRRPNAWSRAGGVAVLIEDATGFVFVRASG